VRQVGERVVAPSLVDPVGEVERFVPLPEEHELADQVGFRGLLGPEAAGAGESARAHRLEG
jgi:hypothetical protein